MEYLFVNSMIVLLLIIINGFFSMSEIAIVSSRKARLQQLMEEGHHGAMVALGVANNPSQFLSTVQIGITLIGILSGAFGGALIADPLSTELARIEILAPYSRLLSVAIVAIITTYLSLVIGELVPKQLALSKAERIAANIAPFMVGFSRLLSPFVYLLSLSTGALLRLVRVTPFAEMPVTEEEIKIMLEEGTQIGVFEPSEQEMVERVFRLGDRTVSALMTPRPEVLWVDLEDSPEEIRQKIATSNHSCLPVAPGDLDNVLGLIYARDLLAQSLAGQPLDLRAVLHPALFVPESMPALEALERFKKHHSHIALVIDEYGSFQGLVTANDILEAIVGDLPAFDDDEGPEVIWREDGSWLLDGKLLVDELKELLEIDTLPQEDSRIYQTLGGFIMAYLERIPVEGDHFELGDHRFEVVDMDGRRVDKVLVTPLALADRPAVDDAS